MDEDFTGFAFERFNLSCGLLKGIFEKGWESPIQEASLEVALSGRDILARAKNGNGKIGAYCMPCIDKIKTDLAAIQALIVVPTHELSLQTSQICVELSKHLEITIMVATDGTDLRDDLMRLNGTVHLVIVAPGRILDLMDKGAAKMKHCNMLILDEADKLLSQDFQSMLDRLVVHLPQKRQVMLYFDVFTHEIASFTQKYLDKPYEIDLLNISPLAETLEEMRMVAEYVQVKYEMLLAENEVVPLKPALSVNLFDANRVFKPLTPVFCLNWGRDNQLVLDAEMANQLPEINSFVDANDGQASNQLTHVLAYSVFPNYKKLLFNYVFDMIINMLENKATRDCFKMNRTDVLRVCVNLANIKNVPKNPNDCWVTGDDAYLPGKDRAFLCLSTKQPNYVAARFMCQLLYGFNSLFNNDLEASHYCGIGDCLIHVCPQSHVDNLKRDTCHSYGCAKWCECVPIRCEFKRDGFHLPCRNNYELERCADGCLFSCFNGVSRTKFQAAINSRKRRAEQALKFVEDVEGEDTKVETVKKVKKWIGKSEMLHDDTIFRPGGNKNSTIVVYNSRSYVFKAPDGTKVAELNKYNARLVCRNNNRDRSLGCHGSAETRKVKVDGRDWSLVDDGYYIIEKKEHSEKCKCTQ